MLVQARADSLRLVRQHDHALMAGALAGSWRGDRGEGALPWTTVLATSLHDVMWREEDRRPRLDPARGRPHDFSSLPADLKAPMVEEGVARLEALDPGCAAVVREHHEALREGREASGEARWVRFFDGLSLFLCLSAPGADPREVPGWVGPGLLAPPLGRPPGGRPLTARWAGPSRLRLRPFPFAGDELGLSVPHRDIPRRPYPDPADLTAAWEAAAEEVLALRVTA